MWSRSPSLRGKTLVVLLAATSAGCAPAGTFNDHLQPTQRGTIVSIDNTNFQDVNIYAVRGASRYRLGTVAGLSKGNLRIPNSILGTGVIRLMVDPIGSASTFTSDALYVPEGGRVIWSIHSILDMSFLMVR